MSEQNINPNQVTKPIQHLAAWLVGLILINGSFLGAAQLIENPDWAPGLLVIAAVLNVPIFLGLIFFLQTKFRAELQEDTFYSKHLEKVTGELKVSPKNSDDFLNHLKSYERINDNKLTELSKSIESIASKLEQNDGSTLDVTSLFEKLNQAKNALSEAEVLKYKHSTKIALNDLLKDYKVIAKNLVKSGYKISDTFGSSSSSKKAPKCLTISITEHINKTALKDIYLQVKEFGFDRIDFDDNREFDKQDIYIGSYIDDFPEERESVIIDEDIESLILNDGVSISELADYIVLNRA